jgi:archaellum biogenesis protein FlaJ (TadC family)
MDLTHIHMLLNHFPIIGTLIGAFVMLWGMMKNQKNIMAVAAVIIVSMAIMAVPVFLTGEPAEERVEHLPGVSESTIEEHEEAAELAIWVMAAAGVASLAALLLQYRSSSKAPFTIATLLTLLAFVAMARVGYLGGQIRHTELRTDQQVSQQVDSEEEADD